AGGQRLHLRLAIDYSSRSALLSAVQKLARSGGGGEASFTEQGMCNLLGPDVDLLIRTSGEQRLSDFLLWECAYAEMVFTSRMWPAFTSDDLASAVDTFHRRDRRFGAVTVAEPARRSA
ncbi:MAG: undecaprenyl diphosphate synthase family protein, partial [Acidobacteriota bacterium]